MSLVHVEAAKNIRGAVDSDGSIKCKIGGKLC